MNDELTKHTLNLFEGDYEKIRSYYPDLGAAVIIRRVLRAFVEQIESKGTSLDAKVEIKL